VNESGPAASRAGATLQARLLLRLDEAPEGPALGFYDGGTLRWLSRQEFHRRASAVAAQLAERGLRPGGACLVVLPSGEQAATVLFAVLLLGGVPLLMSPPLLHGASVELPRLFARCAARSGARLAVCADPLLEMRDLLERAARGVRCLFARDLDQAARPAPAFENPFLPAPTDVAAMQLTSGTTGVPRICVWDHRGVLAALDGMAAAMALSQADVCCNWTPLYHDMGLVNNFLLCLTCGVPLVLLSPHDFIKRPALWLRALATAGATHTWSPNFGFAVAVRKVRDEEVAGIRLDHVRAFWNAAERIHLGTFEAFHRRFASIGVRREALKTNFGCAENVGGATFSDMAGPFVHERVDLALLQARGVARPAAEGVEQARALDIVGVGRPNPGLTIAILSRRGEPLPEGRVGEIALATPSRLLRYQKDARATRRALHGDLLRTGDLGYLRGGELFWVGRLRERITVQGRKVDPSDLEAALAAVPGLREGCFAAFGVFDPQLGTERVVVAAEVRDSSPLPCGEIREQVRRQVFLFLSVTVSEVLLLPPGILTKTSSGKRRHRHFRRLYLEGRLQPLAFSAPPSATAPLLPSAKAQESRP
jgi:acyl-CoA synthetase (AMP-forming)/AMP-acid ligase II